LLVLLVLLFFPLADFDVCSQVSVSIENYELDETVELLSIFDGDSPAAPLAAFIKSGDLPRSDPRWYRPNVHVWSASCAVTFTLQSTRKATLTQPLYTGFASQSGGFALKYGVQDPDKIDYIE
jgi:hypothetical protein